MGPAPEPDYRSALIQAGLGILSQPGGQSPLQAIAQGAQTAMPLYLQEQERVKSYDQQLTNLATKLNMGAAEFEAKMAGDKKGIKCFDGVCIDEDAYHQELRRSGDMETAFEQATVHKKRPAAQDNSRHLAQLRRNLEILKNKPGANPQEIQLAQDELEAMEAQILGGDDKTVTFGMMTEDGTFKTFSGTPENVGGAVARINDADQAKKLQTQQEATDQVLYYASNVMDVFDRASVLSGGKLGGLASTASAWSKALDETMAGPRADQFREEVKSNPNAYIEKLRKDPEARNMLGDGMLESLSSIGQDNAVALSNIVGLAYATARAEEPGGRLSNADVASAMTALGFDPEALLNDPARIRTGVLELAKRNLASYERALDLSGEDADAMKSNDVVLNKRLKEYGFNWTGGPRGELSYDPQRDDENRQDNVSTTNPTPPAPAAQNQGGTAQPAPQGQQPVQVQSKEQFDQLPSGTRFVAPDGSIRVKP